MPIFIGVILHLSGANAIRSVIVLDATVCVHVIILRLFFLRLFIRHLHIPRLSADLHIITFTAIVAVDIELLTTCGVVGVTRLGLPRFSHGFLGLLGLPGLHPADKPPVILPVDDNQGRKDVGPGDQHGRPEPLASLAQRDALVVPVHAERLHALVVGVADVEALRPVGGEGAGPHLLGHVGDLSRGAPPGAVLVLLINAEARRPVSIRGDQQGAPPVTIAPSASVTHAPGARYITDVVLLFVGDADALNWARLIPGTAVYPVHLARSAVLV